MHNIWKWAYALNPSMLTNTPSPKGIEVRYFRAAGPGIQLKLLNWVIFGFNYLEIFQKMEHNDFEGLGIVEILEINDF